MIELKKIPFAKENIEFLKNQLNLFLKKIEGEKHIEPKNNTSEEEKSRLIALINSYIGKLPKVMEQIGDIKSKEDLKKIGIPGQVSRLQIIDESLYQIRNDIEVITNDQFKCNLGNYKRELQKSIIAIIGLFDFLVPNVKNEITYLRKFYKIPSNASNTIIPQLEELIQNLEDHEITLNEFIRGYRYNRENVEGYNDLRVKNNVFSRYQYYEQSAETYGEFNKCIYEICKAIWPFLSEQRSEPEISKLLSQFEEINRKASNPKLGINVSSMNDIFEISSKFHSLLLKVGKKYSYREEYKNVKSKIEEFNKLQKSAVSYFDEVFNNHEQKFAEVFVDKKEKAKFEKVMLEVKKYMEEKILPFDRLDTVFEKLKKKDFNIVVLEKDAEDLTIKITPHLAEKFGENNLKKINIIIQEIDFWFPYESKQWMFDKLSVVTQKIQDDQPLNIKEFMKMLKDFDNKINENYRSKYPNQIKLLNNIVTNFIGIFAHKREREKLNKRLMNKEAWDEILSRAMRVKRNLAVLDSNHESIATNINKFPFLKNALEDLCQLLYDFSMQLFITYEMADQRTITNMTNILSTFNEFHDVKSLWLAFPVYFNQTVISNFYANETKMIRLTHKVFCKKQLDKLFPKQK